MKAILKEPALIAGAIRAIILCAVAFGLGWSADQVAALMLAVEAVLTLLTRALVTPTSTVDGKIADAKTAARLGVILLACALAGTTMTACASVNHGLVLAEDAVHDSLTDANARIQAACPAPENTTSPLAEPCQGARQVMYATLELGATFNGAVQARKVEMLPQLVDAIGRLQATVNTTFDGVTRDAITTTLGRALEAAYQGVKQ